MKLPYGYVLIGGEIVVHEEKADVIRSIFDDYLAGASLGKIVDLLFKRGVISPTGKAKWTRAAVDKLLSNKRAGNTRLNFLRFQEQSNEHFIFTVLFKRKIPRSGKTEIGVFQILF